MSNRNLGSVVVRTLLAVVLGVVVAALGTVVHRYGQDSWYPGLVLALALTAAAGVLARAWAGLGALLGLGAGWLVTVQALSVEGSGGDVIVPAGAPDQLLTVGHVWSYAGLAILALVAFAPASWFAETPVRRRASGSTAA